MKPTVNLTFVLLSLLMLSCTSPSAYTFKSPSGKVEVSVAEGDEGILTYSVTVHGETLLESSSLGVLRSDGDFATGLQLTEVSEMAVIDEQYATPAEKRLNNHFLAHGRSLTVKNHDGRNMVIRFVVADDGVAFRYEFPAEDTVEVTVLSEATSFRFSPETKAWLHPHADAKTGWCETQPSYEENYHADIPVGTPAPQKAGWSFPALFKTGSQWVLVTESGVAPPYGGSRLAQESPGGAYRIAFPQPGETTGKDDPVTPSAKTPFVTPWRVLITGSLATIVESSLVTDLALPSEVVDASFVKPGLASWSWGVLKDESVNFDTQKQFIDYSAEMGWPYCLVDVNWDHQIGEQRIQELIRYAAAKNVGIILWYNSSGSWNSTVYTPKDKMFDPGVRRAEMEKISGWGVKGIKVDFWPGDAPSSIQYYYDLLRDAATYRLMVNFHGTTVPRGWSRTFPHLVSMEAVKGFEFITFDQTNADKATEHCTILPFTRNVAGPMDFTPVCFGEIPRITRHSSSAFELALAIIFQSGIQHIVEIPESMAQQPDFVVDFMKKVPAEWDDLRLIDGFPGKYVVLARKAGEKWFLAGISSSKESLSLKLDLSEMFTGDSLEVIRDGATNREFVKEFLPLNGGKLDIVLPPNGGFVAL